MPYLSPRPLSPVLVTRLGRGETIHLPEVFREVVPMNLDLSGFFTHQGERVFEAPEGWEEISVCLGENEGEPSWVFSTTNGEPTVLSHAKSGTIQEGDLLGCLSGVSMKILMSHTFRRIDGAMEVVPKITGKRKNGEEILSYGSAVEVKGISHPSLGDSVGAVYTDGIEVWFTVQSGRHCNAMLANVSKRTENSTPRKEGATITNEKGHQEPKKDFLARVMLDF